MFTAKVRQGTNIQHGASITSVQPVLTQIIHPIIIHKTPSLPTKKVRKGVHPRPV